MHAHTELLVHYFSFIVLYVRLCIYKSCITNAMLQLPFSSTPAERHVLGSLASQDNIKQQPVSFVYGTDWAHTVCLIFIHTPRLCSEAQQRGKVGFFIPLHSQPSRCLLNRQAPQAHQGCQEGVRYLTGMCGDLLYVYSF